MILFSKSIPDASPSDPVAWAESVGLKVDGHRFDSSLCQQAVAPMRAMSLDNSVCQIGTFIKPIQGGGSTAGEVIAAYWCKFAMALFLYYWQDADVAKRRWKERILPMLQSVDMPWAGGRDELVCEAVFRNVRLRVEGVFSEQALQSDTIPLIINEEIHEWKPGHLVMSRGRQTRVWNKKSFDISNATWAAVDSNKGKNTQLHLAFLDGTQREWLTACPVCGVLHAMRFRWNKSKPELGGLRWDSSTKLPDGRPNYKKLAQTIRYQFPCGHKVKNEVTARRALRGEYSEPRNEGADLSHESWTSEAMSYDQISWLDLIKEWHGAIQALKIGDTAPMFRFVTQRECKFFSDESRPFAGTVITTAAAKQNREGLPGELAKLWAADWQQGFKHLGELTHYWLVIESVLPNCSSQVIFAGVVSDEAELLLTLAAHGISNEDGGGIFDGFIDASKNTKHILSFCYRAGINAVVGGAHGKKGFRHPDGSFRFYSPRKFIYTQLGITFEQAQQDHPDWFTMTREGVKENESCPYVLEYDKAGLLKNYFFIREMKQRVLDTNPNATPADYIERIVPADIGEDYLKHHEAWERDSLASLPKKMGEVEGFKPLSRKDHTMSCSCYIDLKKEESGLLGRRLAELGMKTQTQNENQ